MSQDSTASDGIELPAVTVSPSNPTRSDSPAPDTKEDNDSNNNGPKLPTEREGMLASYLAR